MLTVIISIIGSAAIAIMIVCYACCVVASQADDEMEIAMSKMDKEGRD
jgi:hypothetical protein